MVTINNNSPVPENAAAQAAAAFARDWFRQLKPGSATLQEVQEKHERVFRFDPTNPASSSVVLRIAHYGKFDAYFGTNAGIEELEADSAALMGICEAVRRGQISEDVKEWNGRVVKAHCVIQLPGGPFHDTYIHPLAILPIGQWRHIQYEPWE